MVENLPASNVQANSAALNGRVISTGGLAPNVTLYYGLSDGGTDPDAWDYNISLGTQSGAFSMTVPGLAADTTYYYTAMAENGAGAAWADPPTVFDTFGTPSLVPMLTYHNNNARDGANTNETLLTLDNVNTNNFGKLFSYEVDGYVYAQPLVMTNVVIPGRGIHNVLYVVTEHDTMYAFDADVALDAPYWTRSFVDPAAGVTTVPVEDVGPANISPEIGITSTPVIDPQTGTIYLEVNTKEIVAGKSNYVHRLHALDTATGAERPNSPALINATNYPGSGVPGYPDTDGAGHVVFNGLREMNRPALLLVSNVVYISYASHGDQPPYHGWLFAYDAQTMAQVGVYNATPNGASGGFWLSGGGPAADSSGYVYIMTGNGAYDGSVNFGDSFLKISATNGLKLVDYFTPYNQAGLNATDGDVGSAGLVILPDSVGSGTHQHLLVGGSKLGTMYLLDRTNLGHFNASGDTQIVQAITGTGHGMWCTPAYWNGRVYVGSQLGPINVYAIANGVMSKTASDVGPTTFGYPGATISISANGNSNAIAWAIQNDAYANSGPSVLHAYDATNLTHELYNSSQNLARDYPGATVKYTVPTVVNGKVYMGAEYAVTVFGNGVFLPAPSISPNGGNFSDSQTITLSDSAPDVAIYYTLDGTVPTTNSLLYTGPFDITATAAVEAIAVKAGAMNSAPTLASFIDTLSLGTGTGLTGSYYAGQNLTFNNSPTVVRVDPVINFDWTTSPPASVIGLSTYTVSWTGAVQPQFDETYTFYVNVDDGARVWVNGQLLINDWVQYGYGTFLGKIALKARQLYDIRVDYYQYSGTAVMALQWSSPSTPFAVVPQTQLYPYTNPPPGIALTSPTNRSTFTGPASVTISADAAGQYNTIDHVAFYANGALLGTVSNAPYIFTATNLAQGQYTLTAVATDSTGMVGSAVPVRITVLSGSGQPYGLADRQPVPAFFNMPSNSYGDIPLTLSQTGVFADTSNLTPTSGLIPYQPNTPFWSDNAVKSRWLAVPWDGSVDTPNQQIGFAPTGEWTFPTGTVFVKHFNLVTDETHPDTPPRRLETRLLVRDPDGAVYGVTYKWRPDNSDADLLTSSLSEDIVITNDAGTRIQTWYYPSPDDCLTCHNPVANYVLGVKTRQLNGDLLYPATGQTDNQLRTLNHLGLFNPAIDETNIPGFAQMVSVTNQSATLENRFRSYIDANCAQCHRPNGFGPTFDARYDTPLTNQNIINADLIKGDLGFDNAKIVAPKDIWRSVLYQREITVQMEVEMPPLARNLVDSNAVAEIAEWINSLPGTPALAPPVIQPNGGTFSGQVSVTLQPPDANAVVYYTLDGSLPTTDSTRYSGPFVLTEGATVSANAFEAGYTNSVAASADFYILPGAFFSGQGTITDGKFQFQLTGAPNQTYILQTTTNLVDWIPISTNSSDDGAIYFSDAVNTNTAYRFYRAVESPFP